MYAKRMAAVVAVVVLLAAGVTAQQSEECEEPLSVTATATPVLCYGTMTGAVALNVTEGNDESEFTYTLSNSTVELKNTVGVFTELAAGAYTAEVVRSSDNCSFELAGITVASPEKLRIVTTPAPEVEEPSSCSASDGSITINILGGVAPYTVAIGSTSVKINATESAAFARLAAGTYNVTVADDNNCRAWEVFTISCTDPSFPAWGIAVVVVGGVLVITVLVALFAFGAYKRHQKRYRDVFRDADDEAGIGVTRGDPSDF